MSAFICNDYHISVLAYYATTRNSLTLYPRRSTFELGNILHTENVKSYNHRYEEDYRPDFQLDKRAFDYVIGQMDPMQIIVAADCLSYQSCEHPEWKNSEACSILRQITSHATSNLPGYDQADWSMFPPDNA